MKSFTIYGLAHPLTKRIRYIGKTTSVPSRRNNHLYKARSGRNKTRVGDWIRGLLVRGLQPVVIVLCVGTIDWQKMERAWIKRLRRRGCRLLNSSDGGNGAHTRTTLPAKLVRLLGQISDARIAEQCSLTREAIRYHRVRLGIRASYDPSRKGRPLGGVPWNKTSISAKELRRLGIQSDYSLAKEWGLTKVAVRARRVRLNIPACPNRRLHRNKETVCV
jgi:hypothetical protein